EGCWYDLLVGPLKAVAVREPAEDGDGEVWRYRKAVSGGISPAAAASPKSAGEPPIWIDDKVAAGPPALGPFAPPAAHHAATMAGARGIGAGGSAERKAALARGTHAHRLLQALPNVPTDARIEAARRYLARAQDLAAQESEGIIEQVQRLLDDARFAELFQP